MRIHLRGAYFKLLLSSLLISALLFALACGRQAEEYRRPQAVANEASAVRALQNIFMAQTQYAAMHPGDYGTFDQLVAAGTLDKRFAGVSPASEGYVFTMSVVPQADARPASFSINADPKQAEGVSRGASNARHLYLDSTGNVVRVNAARAATADDPPLQQ